MAGPPIERPRNGSGGFFRSRAASHTVGPLVVATLPPIRLARDGSRQRRPSEVGELGMHISAGDTAWMLTSTALVLFMMPGLALFYGGLVGAKNVIATMVQSFIAIGLISLLW